MADIRISGKDLAKIDALQKRVSGAVSQLSPRIIERLSVDIADRLQSGIQRLLSNIDAIEARIGITDPDTKRNVRSALEGAEGATSAIKNFAPFITLLTANPTARIVLLLGTALFGAVEGSSREEQRRAIDRAKQIEENAAYEFHRARNREAADRREAEAARKRAKRIS